MASYVEEQYIQALEKENAELKRQLENRRETEAEMLKNDQEDSRRFQLMRLNALLTMENYFINQMRDIPHWDWENTWQLMAVLNQSIARENEKLCHMDIADLSPYHPASLTYESNDSPHCHKSGDSNPHNHKLSYEEECLEHLNRANELGFDPLIGFPVPEGWEPEKVE